MAMIDFFHCGFTVTNIERTVDFYKNILGMELIVKGTNEGETLGISLGLKESKARIKVAFMKAGDTLVEFIEYVEPKSKPCPKDPSVAGSSHISFRVDDINETRKKLENAGVKFLSDVNVVEQGEFRGAKWCYFRDLDGIPMEIAEEIPREK